MKMDIEADDGASGIPPSAMTFGVTPKYGELASFCKRSGFVFETASYRIASDGKFICRNIESKNVSFYFRDNAFNENEIPFVVKRKLAQG
jgi:hypothetical protein